MSEKRLFQDFFKPIQIAGSETNSSVFLYVRAFIRRALCILTLMIMMMVCILYLHSWSHTLPTIIVNALTVGVAVSQSFLPILSYFVIFLVMVYAISQLLKTIMLFIITPSSFPILQYIMNRQTANTSNSHDTTNNLKSSVSKHYLQVNGLDHPIIWFHNENKPWIIYCHGNADHTELLFNDHGFKQYFQQLYQDYTVLLISPPTIHISDVWLDYYHHQTPMNGVNALFYLVKQAYPNMDVCLYGHSMGGAIIQEALSAKYRTDHRLNIAFQQGIKVEERWSTPDPKLVILDRTFSSLSNVISGMGLGLLSDIPKWIGYNYKTMKGEPVSLFRQIIWMLVVACLLMVVSHCSFSIVGLYYPIKAHSSFIMHLLFTICSFMYLKLSHSTKSLSGQMCQIILMLVGCFALTGSLAVQWPLSLWGIALGAHYMSSQIILKEFHPFNKNYYELILTSEIDEVIPTSARYKQSNSEQLYPTDVGHNDLIEVAPLIEYYMKNQP
ncbi:MAG: hypothetical protein ACON5A_06170 [Candidatus Comchoanobacterales bacterium]